MPEFQPMTTAQLESLPVGTVFVVSNPLSAKGEVSVWQVINVPGKAALVSPVSNETEDLEWFASDSVSRQVGVFWGIRVLNSPVPHGKPQKLRIYFNRKLDVTPNKRAAHAVHAALEAFGVHPGVKVIVLDKGPTAIEEMRIAIHDAGHTELEPGTLTAGTNWPEDSDE
jgi:PTH2 family peptidyl-tRNA hydrolase